MDSAAELKVDESAWPLIVITCPPELEEGSIAPFAKTFEGIFARREKFAIIVDTLPVRRIPNARWRKEMAAWMNAESVKDAQALCNVGSSTIISSGPMRGALTALYWLWKPPTPQHAARGMRDALEWCIARLEDNGVPLSPELVRLRDEVGAA